MILYPEPQLREDIFFGNDIILCHRIRPRGRLLVHRSWLSSKQTRRAWKVVSETDVTANGSLLISLLFAHHPDVRTLIGAHP
jgi:hypothetical protein